MICKYCDNEEMSIKEVIFKNGTKHLERKCVKCGRQNGYAPKDIDPNDWRLPFGKYKGKTLGEVLKEDKSYLEWLYDNSKKETMRNRIDEVLGGQDITQIK